MINLIDNFLNRITMYRLVLYYLILLLVSALTFSLFGILPYNPLYLLLSTLIILAVSLLTNDIFAKTFHAMPNVESVYITALILSLVITPAKNITDVWVLFWAAVWAMASKYIFAWDKKHIFNPVAIAVVITSFFINGSATWWVGTAAMLPLVLLGGLLIVRKIRRFDLVLSFLGAGLAAIITLTIVNGSSLATSIEKSLIYSPIFFFAFVMITEPLTTPPTGDLRLWYGVITGILFAPQFHLGSIYSTPELALVVGNIYSYIVSPKGKLLLALKEKIQLAPDIYDFVFTSPKRLAFAPGQYLEWTLVHNHPDTRGNRRYFTIASAPTESEIRMGVKFYEGKSSFKQQLLSLNPGDEILAGQLAGDFTLPKDKNQKIALIAGGIGITPFRSMVKDLLDRHEKRDVVLFFANKTAGEVIYTDIFNLAHRKLNIKTIYTLTGVPPSGWTGETGRITPEMIQREVPDYYDRLFYLSGPHAMITTYEAVLAQMDIPRSRIKTDYFPGFA